MIARAIQFFAPGTPQVYYVGLLAGENDVELVERTGVGRDINRHYYTLEEIHEGLQRPVVKQLLELIRLRNALSVFRGTFSIEDSSQSELILRWESGNDRAELRVDLEKTCATIDFSDSGTSGCFNIGDTSLMSTVEPS